jgi:hypothetical protein
MLQSLERNLNDTVYKDRFLHFRNLQLIDEHHSKMKEKILWPLFDAKPTPLVSSPHNDNKEEQEKLAKKMFGKNTKLLKRVLQAPVEPL